MLSYRILLIFCALSISQSAAAAPGEKGPKLATKTKITKRPVETAPTEEARPTRSMDIREQKSLTVGVRAGAFMGSTFGPGAEVGWNLGRRVQLSGNYFQGAVDKSDLSDSQIDSYMTLGGKQYALQTRFFIANSFYAGLSLGQRVIDYSIHLEDHKNAANSVDANGSVKSNVAVIDIGNMWTFQSGFYIGADWAGYTTPLSSTFTSETKTSGVVTAGQKDFVEVNEGLGKSLGRIGSTQLLMMNLGWMI